MAGMKRFRVVMMLALLSVGGCAWSATTAVEQLVDVSIKNLKFVPQDLTVTPGTTIRWTNADSVDHDVTSGTAINGRQARGLAQTKFPDNQFASGLFSSSKSFSVTLDKTGEYNYYCNIHPFMTGKITVR